MKVAIYDTMEKMAEAAAATAAEELSRCIAEKGRAGEAEGGGRGEVAADGRERVVGWVAAQGVAEA